MAEDKKSVRAGSGQDATLDSQQMQQQMAAWTPARIFRGGAGTAMSTRTQLELRFDHAAAVDAVYADGSMSALLPADLIAATGIIELSSSARSRAEYLARPESGRRLSEEGRALVRAAGGQGRDIQLLVGDGLSAAAVRVQVPQLLPALMRGIAAAGLAAGKPFYIRNCRVGVLNDVGEILRPKIAILLIGERPGLSTAESLSAYMAWRPDATHTDANRNLISNIHARGVQVPEAVARVMGLVRNMLTLTRSGVEVKEDQLWRQHLRD